MKNLAKFFVAVAALFVGVSCTTDTTEDLGQQIVGKGQTVLTVSTGESVLDTKTSLGGEVDGTYPIYWSNGDQLSLNGVASAPLADVAANATTASFTWEGTFDAPFCVAYPASKEGTVTFAAEQEYVPGTFSQNAVPMIGYSDEVGVSGVTLQYLAGVLQFNVSGAATLASMIIETVDGTPIAGVFDCDFATGTVKPQAGSRSSIEYSFGEAGLDISGGVSFHVAVPAGKYDAVKVIMLEANGGAFEGTVKADGTVKPELAAGQVREFTISNWSANRTYTVIKDAQTLSQFAESAEDVEIAVVLKDVDASSIADTWAPIEGFTGLLRGNGKTISGLTKPLFGELKGTVTNLTYEANVAPGAAASKTDASKNLAAIFANTTNGATLTSCTVKGSLTINNGVYVPTTNANTGEFWFAGFAAQSTNTTFANCTNDATITITKSMKATSIETRILIGGISAYPISGCKFVDCVNNGQINYPDAGVYDNKTWGCVGGILGYSENETNSITGCVNNGKYYHTAHYVRAFGVGGIVGKATKFAEFSNCVNNGDLETTSMLSYGMMGGIVGQLSCTMSNCKNNGRVSLVRDSGFANKYAYYGGVVGYATTAATINNCENHGELYFDILVYGNPQTATTGYIYIGGIVGRDNGVTSGCTNYGNITSKGKRGGEPNATAVTSSVGGISAYKSNAISGCTNKGKIICDIASYNTVYANYNQPQNIGGIVGYCSTTIQDCHNEGDIVFPATANSNTISMGGIGGVVTEEMSDCDNKGKIQLLGTINGDSLGMHRVHVGGIVGRGNALTNVHNLEGGDVIVSGNLVVPSTAGNSYGGGWGSFGIGGVSGMAAALHTKVSNAANVTVSSNIAAVPSTDGKNAYTMHPVLVSGASPYLGNSNNVNVSNSGTVTVSGTHSYNTSGLYVGGVGARSANNAGYTYTSFVNSGNVNVSVSFDNKVTCSVSGISAYSSAVAFTDARNEGNITVSAKAKGDLAIGGILPRNGGDHPSVLTNCDNSGKIKFLGEAEVLYMGGIYGVKLQNKNDENDAVTGCDNTGDITLDATAKVTGYCIGGIGGFSVADLTSCTNNGAIKVLADQLPPVYSVDRLYGSPVKVGGIVGSGNGHIVSCENKENGDITVSGDIYPVVKTEVESIDAENGDDGWPNTTIKTLATNGGNGIGGVVAVSSGAYLKDCKNRGALDISSDISKFDESTGYTTTYGMVIGGIIGYTSNALDLEKPSYNYGEITVSGDYTKINYALGVGGCIGRPTAAAQGGAHNEGHITIKAQTNQFYVGGIFGLNSKGTWSSCSNKGNILIHDDATATGTCHIAGIGYQSSPGKDVSTTWTDLHNSGNITVAEGFNNGGSLYVAGIGYVYCNISYSSNKGNICAYNVQSDAAKKVNVGMITSNGPSSSKLVTGCLIQGSIQRNDNATPIEITEENYKQYVYNTADTNNRATGCSTTVMPTPPAEE